MVFILLLISLLAFSILVASTLASKPALAHGAAGRGRMGEFFVKLLGGLIVAFFTGTGVLKNWPRLKRWAAARDLTAGDATHFTILVAELEDDDEKRSQTKHVIQSLRTQFGAHQSSKAFAVVDYPRVLKAGIVGSLDQRDEDAERKGRDWLNEKNAHLLIWGSVAAANKVIRLRFLPREGEARHEKGYVLSETLELPIDFKGDLATGLMAYVLGQAAPAFEAKEPLVQALKPLLEPLQNLVTNGRENLGDQNWANLCNSAAVVFGRFGEQSGDPAYLESSEAAYREALKVRTQKDMPAQWAITQNNLGTVLRNLGQRAEGKVALDYLKSSETAYRQALKVHTQKDIPAQWAMTQNNLGIVLSTMGERAEGKAALDFLKKSIKAFQHSLEIYGKPGMEHYASAVSRNLAHAQAILAAKNDK